MEEVKDSRGKRKFWIPVWNGIFEHREKMTDALWLFLWYIDKTTREEDGGEGGKVGRVLGGKPIRDSEVAPELQCTKRTICTWRNRLQKHGYIKVIRTPYGYTVRVLKSKKWFGKNPEPHSAETAEGSGSGKTVPRDSPVASQSERQIPSQTGKQADNLIKTTQENTKRSDITRTNQPSQTDGLVSRLAQLFHAKTGRNLTFTRGDKVNIAAVVDHYGEADVITAFEKWLGRAPGIDGIKWPLSVFIGEYVSFSPQQRNQIKRQRREESGMQFMERYRERGCPRCGAKMTNEGNGYVSCCGCGQVFDAPECLDRGEIVGAGFKKVSGG
jgi:hypothetical protein